MPKKNKSQPKIASAPSSGREVRANFKPHSKEVRTRKNKPFPSCFLYSFS